MNDTEQRRLLQKILEQSGEQIEENKLNEVLHEIKEMQNQLKVEELESIINHSFPGFNEKEASVDNSDLDGLLEGGLRSKN